MTTVFVVTRGDYSDYSICAICSTKRKAEKAAALFGERIGNTCSIEKWELNEYDFVPAGKSLWDCVMARDGSDAEVEKALNPGKFHWLFWQGERIRFGNIAACDAEHAIKIANEFRSRIIAQNEWGTEFAKWAKKYGT